MVVVACSCPCVSLTLQSVQLATDQPALLLAHPCCSALPTVSHVLVSMHFADHTLHCVTAQFRAVSDQLYRSPDYHESVRMTVVQQLRAHGDNYKDYLQDDYQAYCDDMAKVGTWGDHVTLQAAADAYKVQVYIVSSFLENCVIKIDYEGCSGQQDRSLWISFWAEVTFGNSLQHDQAWSAAQVHHVLCVVAACRSHMLVIPGWTKPCLIEVVH